MGANNSCTITEFIIDSSLRWLNKWKDGSAKSVYVFVCVCFPVTKIRSNWRELCAMWYNGVRGLGSAAFSSITCCLTLSEWHNLFDPIIFVSSIRMLGQVNLKSSLILIYHFYVTRQVIFMLFHWVACIKSLTDGYMFTYFHKSKGLEVTKKSLPIPFQDSLHNYFWHLDEQFTLCSS